MLEVPYSPTKILSEEGPLLKSKNLYQLPLSSNLPHKQIDVGPPNVSSPNSLKPSPANSVALSLTGPLTSSVTVPEAVESS